MTDAGLDAGPGDAGAIDAGRETGTAATCAPASGDCVFLSELSAQCGRTPDDARFQLCPAGNSVHRVELETCDEGTKWVATWSPVGPTTTCVYATDGGLIGASHETDFGVARRAGQWGLVGCQPRVDACGDAGACEPRRAGATCESLHQFRHDCDATAEAQQQRVCTTDAGRWQRSSCADGGGEWVEPLGHFGARTSCVYDDGRLVGASRWADAGVDSVAGRWLPRDCVELTTCP